MIRHGLVLTAVVTVTFPCLLAVLAVRGHGHVASAADVAAAAPGSVSVTSPLPVAPASARTGVRDSVAAVPGASGTPVTVLTQVTTGQQVMGLHLLNAAADASLVMSYQGTELISQSGVGGSVEMISQVWHQGGGVTLVETSSGATSAAAQPVASAVASTDPATGSPEGVFGVTESLVALLGKHYVAAYRGSGAAVGRAAAVVDLYRFDGSLAAQYWLDKQTMVPLRRELFGTADNVVSTDSFVRVQFGGLAMPQFAVNASAALPRSQSQSAWATAAQPARFLSALAGQGWPAPVTLPGNLPLYAAASTGTASGEIVDLEYSDGLYDVSLFVQRGTLAPDMAGWRPVTVSGQQAFVSGHSVTWAGPGFVYTMIADAPPQTMTQVVGALPRGGQPSVLDRLGRGFARLARVLDPFA